MANNITYQLGWQLTLVAVPQGAGPMEVPSMQRLQMSSAYAGPGGTPPGRITVASTGNFPTSANIVTACNAAATAAATLFNANAQASQWQGWNTGGG